MNISNKSIQNIRKQKSCSVWCYNKPESFMSCVKKSRFIVYIESNEKWKSMPCPVSKWSEDRQIFLSEPHALTKRKLIKTDARFMLDSIRNGEWFTHPIKLHLLLKVDGHSRKFNITSKQQVLFLHQTKTLSIPKVKTMIKKHGILLNNILSPTI
jgi:hypothetical protein